ncbi:MAG: pyrimidine 5'-nucleotidase [Rhodospirillales bacterium]|jgi:putative hydrolase of the HAD superfamily|nr:pyrimidine 5'-nucleotidase [Rhodospirillales bacterium]MDP6884581.1 pyrimidine 5'-nucleotidase [Rhodospirillales bacterium]
MNQPADHWQPDPLSDADQATLRQTETWVFDLDNTLYPASTNLFGQIDLRMRDFIAQSLNLDLDEARTLQKTYFHTYGTTLRGLMEHHAVDAHAFLDYVHDIDIEALAPSPALDAALDRLSGRKLIFTNASTGHARRVMRRLGVERHFEDIFDIADADFEPKPVPAVYARLVARHRIDPGTSVMVEDIARNLEPAAALGMTTVWVRTNSEWGREGNDGAHVHHVVDDLAAWLAALTGGVAC